MQVHEPRDGAGRARAARAHLPASTPGARGGVNGDGRTGCVGKVDTESCSVGRHVLGGV